MSTKHTVALKQHGSYGINYYDSLATAKQIEQNSIIMDEPIANRKIEQITTAILSL